MQIILVVGLKEMPYDVVRTISHFGLNLVDRVVLTLVCKGLSRAFDGYSLRDVSSISESRMKIDRFVVGGVGFLANAIRLGFSTNFVKYFREIRFPIAFSSTVIDAVEMGSLELFTFLLADRILVTSPDKMMSKMEKLAIAAGRSGSIAMIEAVSEFLRSKSFEEKRLHSSIALGISQSGHINLAVQWFGDATKPIPQDCVLAAVETNQIKFLDLCFQRGNAGEAQLLPLLIHKSLESGAFRSFRYLTTRTGGTTRHVHLMTKIEVERAAYESSPEMLAGNCNHPLH